MGALTDKLRKLLEKAVVAGRDVAENGARQALQALAVHEAEPYKGMPRNLRDLRNRLRAHARQLGDDRDRRRETQEIDHLLQEVAYEHWNRMLFSRLLAENDLLLEPKSKVAISLEQCRDLAREQRTDPWMLASQYAQHMLPEIFRPDDPVLQVGLPQEDQRKLEELLEELPREVFLADDSLGWVYQFWQAKRKDEVNASGRKIGADEIAAVTQLFTEHYMVLFLLHNTIGAWHAAKVLKARPELAVSATCEDELRRACALPSYEWQYLRFVREDAGKGPWRPAAGSFNGWPGAAKDITLLDPCCGSGHFLVAAFECLVRLRVLEEGLSKETAAKAVIGENIFGLEIDSRCTQIAAFALAFATWRFAGGVISLPPLRVACSGLSVGLDKDEWVRLGGKDGRLKAGMDRLYDFFKQGPTLGSLIDPRAGDMFEAAFHELKPLLEQALAREVDDETQHELAVTARGLAHAAEILAGRFTLVATNVPYLGRGKQGEVLREYCKRVHADAKADLATCFIERCLAFCHSYGSTALVTPQNWLYQPGYGRIRNRLLQERRFDAVVRLGGNAFQMMNFWAAPTALSVISASQPSAPHEIFGVDASVSKDRIIKDRVLRGVAEGTSSFVEQASQLKNPDSRISMELPSPHAQLGRVAITPQGLKTGDDPRFRRNWWELESMGERWRFLQGAPDCTRSVDGACYALDYGDGASEFARPQGQAAWGKVGFVIKLMGGVTAARYLGTVFDSNVTALVPHASGDLPAMWTYVSSDEFEKALRGMEQSVKVNNATVGKVPFDRARWTSEAAKRFPDGLPPPKTTDATQWVFAGHPRDTESPLHVAVARLLGYRWPRQTGSSFPGCSALGPDSLEEYADKDGIVCLPSVRGEEPAAERLRTLLATTFGKDWSPARERELLSATGSKAEMLEEWLRDDSFVQHCGLFHHRPFIWHIWDGRKDGFHSFVNCHRLAEGNGRGRKLLETLTYSYLGDWIARRKEDVKGEVTGAEGRLAAAAELQRELELILAGEPPYDLFVRWKTLHQQPIGWDPDINDGVRLNIRPFMSAQLSGGRAGAGLLRWKPNISWEKDRGSEPSRPKEECPWFWDWDGKSIDWSGGRKFTGERHNACHFTNAAKQSARDKRGKQ